MHRDRTEPDSAARPLRRDAERNRQRILEAARVVFAERGLGATLDEIAHAAGVGVGTVYRRYPDKEELIDALFEQSINRIAALAEEGIANPDPWAGLVGFFERALEEQARDRGLKELLLSDAHGRERVALGRARIAPRVQALVARAQASGDLRPDIAATDLPLIQLMLGAALDYTRDVAPDSWQRFLVLVLDGMRAARDEPTPLAARPLTDDEIETVMHSVHRPRPARGGRGRAADG
jgi:AcrR family transcriptional regulator